MSHDFYAGLAADYDRVIRWEKRLVFERPLFDALWHKYGTHRLLDASCGTGHHLKLFAASGLEVYGSDASDAMVALARQNAEGCVPADRIVQSTWSDLAERLPQTFDAVLCIGNSLPYVVDDHKLGSSLEGLWSRVAPGGFLLVQFKNFEKLRVSGQRFLPLAWSDSPHETVALRMYDFEEDTVLFNVILLKRIDSDWQMQTQATRLKTYAARDIVPLLHALGARTTDVHGSLKFDDYDAHNSDDIVVLATKGETK